MRVVLDTNILARAIGSRTGPAGELFERIAANHVLIVSSDLLEELSRVLQYDRLRRMHQRSDADIADLIANIRNGGREVPLPDHLPRVVPHDPDDDVVVATAIAGTADVLCTRNGHLFDERVISYCRQHAVEIMDDIELLALLREHEVARPSDSNAG